MLLVELTSSNFVDFETSEPDNHSLPAKGLTAELKLYSSQKRCYQTIAIAIASGAIVLQLYIIAITFRNQIVYLHLKTAFLNQQKFCFKIYFEVKKVGILKNTSDALHTSR